MLHNIIASSSAGEGILIWIEYAALAIEVVAVAIIVVSILSSTIRYIFQAVLHPGFKDQKDRYQKLKMSLGRTLLLGLEMMVAADIVRTVALEATLESVLVLGLLVLIRTFLSWALVVEIEGRWPWQPERKVE